MIRYTRGRMTASPAMPVMVQPRRLQPRRMILPLLALAALFAWTTWRNHQPAPAAEFRLAGETMGTVYHITLVGAELTEARAGELAARIETVLEEVNRQMSTYRPDSEISRFNRAAAGEEVPISPAFERVVRFALELAERSGGAFDPTVAPLVDLWGFGPAGRRAEPPAPEAIAAARAGVGHRHVTLPRPGVLVKDLDGVRLDLSAVAKGYGVDAVAAALAEAGVNHLMVEIGGEVYAAGKNARGAPWRIGVDRPQAHAVPGADLAGILHLSNLAVASSGDYRNFFTDEDGAVYAHILDPRRGEPVRRPPTGVTVVAPDCLTADGLATTLFVLGTQEGLAWLKTNFPAADAWIVERTAEGGTRTAASEGFARHLAGATGAPQ